MKTAASIAGYAAKFGMWFGGLFKRQRLHFVHQRYRRSMGGWGYQPAMNLMIDFWVTNSYDFPVKICRGEVKYRTRLRRRIFSRIQVTDYMPPRIAMDFRAMFPITPPPVPDDKPFQATLFFIDNFNRRHKAGKFVFETHEPNQPCPPD
ncbi:MAG: hypothetical protein NTW28_12510 [Candidatus Solibacter sp.]|nr:hypothetical protein [Candidatus Solibacter sp.]